MLTNLLPFILFGQIWLKERINFTFPDEVSPWGIGCVVVCHCKKDTGSVTVGRTTSTSKFQRNFIDKLQTNQWDKIGPFLNVFGTQVAQEEWWLSGLCCKRSIYVKLLWLQFGQLLEAFGYFLTPTSGHAGTNSRKVFNRKINSIVYRQLEFYTSLLCLKCPTDASF